MKIKITAILHKENKGYWAEIPEFPGCLSQGNTLKETKTNIAEAAELWLECQKKDFRTKYKNYQIEYKILKY